MLAKNDNQRLQNELNHMERKFQRLDSRKISFIFFLKSEFIYIFSSSVRYKTIRINYSNKWNIGSEIK
jgi:hypothetical protein